MSAILFTNGYGLQPRAPLRKTSASCGSVKDGMTDEGGPRQEANVKPRLHEDAAGSYLKRARAGAGVETALFVSVQAVMLVCIVLVAAQLFATA